ncbi:MAG: ABC transporter ATP-binding protein [Planctomycetota bacterium]
MTNAILEVRDLVRTFGSFNAVDRVSFRVERGEVAGFIGPNGAGKTTTMRIAATLDLPDGGDVFIDGESVVARAREVRRRLGFMPDAYGAYSATTVHDYLDFFARAYGLSREERRETIRRLVDFVQLGDLLEKDTSELSKGMRQRLCLAKTLLHDPDLMILDEPASGLDPRARIELRELVKALAGMGKAILISSHILSELGEMCDSIIVIERGVVLAQGRVDELSRGLRQRTQLLYVKSFGPLEALERALLEEAGVQATNAEEAGLVVRFSGDEQGRAALLARLVTRGVPITEFRSDAVGLEDVFLDVTRGRVQ